MTASSSPALVVFGEALTDFVHHGDGRWQSAAGGACWNVARVAATLGTSAAWAGAVSNDAFGQQIVEQSRIAGLDLDYIQVVDKPPLLAMVTQIDPPRYLFIGNDAADLAFDATRMPAGWQGGCRIAHFGCISLVRQPLGERLLHIAESLKLAGVQISFDPNHRALMGPDYPALFARLAAIADILKVSDEDLAGIYPGLPLQESLQRVLELAPRARIVHTHGAAGMTLHYAGMRLAQASFPVQVADTVGAGDACMGAFLAHRLAEPDAPPAAALRYAAAAGAATCMQVGAHAPSPGELDALLDRAAVD